MCLKQAILYQKRPIVSSLYIYKIVLIYFKHETKYLYKRAN